MRLQQSQSEANLPRALRNGERNVRAAILGVATRLFAERGDRATSLQAIATEVGIRKQSLLYHFRSKEELRRKVLETLLERWNDTLPQLLVAAPTAAERLDTILGAVLDFFAEDPDRARLLVREMLDRPAQMREMLQKHTAGWLEIISNALRRGQEEGIIHQSVDPEAYVATVIHLILSGISAHSVMDAILNADPRGSSFERYRVEVLRLAKVGLFCR